MLPTAKIAKKIVISSHTAVTVATVASEEKQSAKTENIPERFSEFSPTAAAKRIESPERTDFKRGETHRKITPKAARIPNAFLIRIDAAHTTSKPPPKNCPAPGAEDISAYFTALRENPS